MGYTNYWQWTTAIADADKFAAWSRDVQQLLEYFTTPESAFPDYISFFGRYIQDSESPVFCGPDGTGNPVITSELVAFNGNASREQDCEAFIISCTDLQEPQPFAFCKTATEPYDLLVLCALVRFAHYFAGVRLWSDGEEQAIHLGIRMCRDLFGENNQPMFMSLV